MRKFLLILLNVLCLSGAIGQTKNLTAFTVHKLGASNDTIQFYEDSKYYSDKKTCLDTFHFVQLYTQDYLQKIVRHRRYKYDKQNRLVERAWRDTTFTRSDVKSSFSYLRNIERREIYAYTAPTVRADTMFLEQYNYSTNTWERTRTTYMGKAGTGNDTFKLALKTMVFDSKGNNILEFNKNSNGITLDSTIISYLNNQKSKVIFYKNGELKYVINYNFDGANILTEQKLSYSGNTVIDTNTHSYLYKNGLLDTEEYEVKDYTYTIATKVKTYSLYEKYKLKYTYDLNRNKTIVESYTWDFPQNKWVISALEKITYSSDSLKVKTVNSTYTNGILDANVVIDNHTYELCTPVVSDVKEVLGSLDFIIAPNPSTGYFTLTLDTEGVEINNTKVQIFNLQGQEVYNTKVNNSVNSIDISHLNKGFYLVKVSDKAKSNVKKLVLN
jgi:Secretion system C-terminal sorting domain